MIKFFCECGHRIIAIETVWLHYHGNKITRKCQKCDCSTPRKGERVLKE